MHRRDGRYLQQGVLYLRHTRPAESELWATLLNHRAKLCSHAVKPLDPPTFKRTEGHMTF